MFPISNEALSLFMHPYRQVADITFYGTEDTIQLTEKDIIAGGLSLNRYCTSGSRIEIGSVIASEMTFQLDNSQGRFDDTVFEGAELFVRVGTTNWEDYQQGGSQLHYVPLGYYTVDEAPRKLEVINLKALDRMVLFDKTVNDTLLVFPMRIETLLSRICEICNVQIETDTSQLPNKDYVVNELPQDSDLTYRQYLSWIAEITGTCGFMDWNGHLVLKWFEETNTVITSSERFDSDLQENSITISGVQVVNDGVTYLVGDDGYAFNIDSNSLIQHDFRLVAEALSDVLTGFTYTPFSATIKPMPHLYPLDIITFVDKNGTSHNAIITDYTFVINKNMFIEGKGETLTQNGRAAANPLTKRESTIINAIKKENNETLNTKIQSVLSFNELISNSLGVRSTPVVQSNGSVIYYLHNNPKLEESSTIFTMSEGGTAWTTSGWNNGSPVWSYGTTAAGDALFRMLSAEGIQVSKAGEDYSIELTPRTFKIYYKEMLVTNIEADEMTIPKARFTTHAEIGKIRFIPYTIDGVLSGTNIVYMD